MKKDYKELDPVNIFVPDYNQIIIIKEGSGDNLDKEDIENGYVDYIYYSQYSLDEELGEVDGGMIMIKEPLVDLYSSLRETIVDVLEFAYGKDPIPDYVLLNKRGDTNSEESKDNV